MPLQTGVEHRRMAKLLAGVDVGDVHFDGGQVAGGDGVAQGDAAVAEGAGVDDRPAASSWSAWMKSMMRAFVVGLKRDDLSAEVCGART